LLTFSIKVSFCQETFHYLYDYYGSHNYGNSLNEYKKNFFLFGAADFQNNYSWILNINHIGKTIDEYVFNLGNAVGSVEDFEEVILFNKSRMLVSGTFKKNGFSPDGFIGIFNPNFADSFKIIFSDIDTN